MSGAEVGAGSGRGSVGADEGFDLAGLGAEIEEVARELEPRVSVDLRDLAEKNGARLEDLDTRFKTQDSIVRKMRNRLRYNPDVSEGRLKRSVDDALRYTVVAGEQNYAEIVREILIGMRQKGYEFSDRDIRNSWPENDIYKGINCTLRTRGGTCVFEVQFHTDASLRAKHGAHPLYEQRRSAQTPIDGRRELDEQMRELFGKIPIPPGVGEIGRVVERR